MSDTTSEGASFVVPPPKQNRPKRNWRPVIALGCLVACIAVPLSIPLFFYWGYYRDFRVLDEHLIPETYRRGNVLVAQLMNYRADHGDYPPNLGCLEATGYTKTIEQPTWGDRQWVYTGDVLDLHVERYGNSYPGIYFTWRGWRIGGELVSKDWNDPPTAEERDAYRIGDSIVVGLLRFQNAEGRLPATLDELVESPHLDTLESPSWGKLVWDYKVQTPVPPDPTSSNETLPYWENDDYPVGYTLAVRSEPPGLIVGHFQPGSWTFDH